MSAFTAQVGDSGVDVIKAPVAWDLVRGFIAQVRQDHLCKQRRIEAFREGGFWCKNCGDVEKWLLGD